MGYAALMVHVEPDDAAEPRIRLAADLADRFEAALIGFAGATVMPPPVTAPVLGPGVAVEVLEAEQRRVEAGLRAAHERFRTIAERDGRRTGWRSFLDHPAAALAREARAADLLIGGRGGGAFGLGRDQTVDAGDLLMRAGRPVLVVPPGVAVLEARRVLVAWKDTREARRAVADALPLLADAEEVLVVEAVPDEAGDREAATRRTGDVAALLERHGATARGETLESHAGRAVADALLRAAERHGADLVVAGGYGHARLREWAFGGVTRDLLARCPVCCLLSH
ncbi:universal stress protein [Craurococcus roseus]|uniref:Universal stress protein n=1 Tax=Craurococcus roseus TaxID=77585 RepID=A0ABP3R1F7_9PROT